MRKKANRPRRMAAMLAAIFFFAPAEFVYAQGLNGLSQLLGNGSQQTQGFGGLSQLLGAGGFQHSRNSDQSGTPVTVQRGAAPYTGEFTGKEATSSGFHSFSSRFTCYPARDPIFAQTETFVCYTAQTSAN
jgi:hypothetical protein